MLIVGLIVLLLFGKRLPGLMRSMGESVVEFKKGVNQGIEEGAESDGKPVSKEANTNSRDAQKMS